MRVALINRVRHYLGSLCPTVLGYFVWIMGFFGVWRPVPVMVKIGRGPQITDQPEADRRKQWGYSDSVSGNSGIYP